MSTTSAFQLLKDESVRQPAEHNVRDFLRGSKALLDEAADRDILLRRRDGADLILTDWDREETVRESLGLTALLLMEVLRSDLSAEVAVLISQAIARQVQWTGFLPDADQNTFVSELSETSVKCVSLGHFEPLVQLLREWRATALINADPKLRGRLLAAYDEPAGELVPRPELARGEEG
jgi:hypothetical protein